MRRIKGKKLWWGCARVTFGFERQDGSLRFLLVEGRGKEEKRKGKREKGIRKEGVWKGKEEGRKGKRGKEKVV